MTAFATPPQSGMTLVEVLAALVVLALGLIGVASLQIHGLRNVKVSGDVQAVSQHLNQLTELMRMNKQSASDYDALTSSQCPSTSTQALTDFCLVAETLSDELGASDVTLTIVSCTAPDAMCEIQAQWTPRQAYRVTTAAEVRSYALSVLL